MTCHGVAEVTIAGGKIVWRDGKLHTEEGHGKLVQLPPNCSYVYSRIQQRDTVEQAVKVEREPYPGPVIDLSGSAKPAAAAKAVDTGKQPPGGKSSIFA